MTDPESDPAELFHENSKITPFDVGADLDDLPPIEPGVFLGRVRLPKVSAVRGVELEEAVLGRVTCRDYDPRVPLSQDLLSRLLAFGCGFTAPSNFPLPSVPFRRAAPSAGATYPLEIYPVVLRALNIRPGVYHYANIDHSLELLRPGDFRTQLAEWTLGQPYIADASVVFVIAGFPGRIRPRYKERGYRYMLLEAGHVAQNFYLLSTAYGLGATADGGFVDAAFNRLLGLNDITEIALYNVAVGVPRPA
ncbi:MAG: SagB/ThcOx family dehydrogenase [Acidobacteria bacterium]|nr:SagB/ThcOx family dehydrogenase [Acidobacteriota bacterium]